MSFVSFLLFLLLKFYNVTNGQEYNKCTKVKLFVGNNEQILNRFHCNALLTRINELEKKAELQQGKIRKPFCFLIVCLK